MRRRENKRVSDLFLRWSEVGDPRSCSFDNFTIQQGTEAALKLAREYARQFEVADGKWLLIFGPPGNGKTHLGMAIRNQVERDHGVKALAITQPYLLQEIRASWNRRLGEDADGRSEDWILEQLQQAPFVLIDDLMRWPDWADDRMFVLLDARYRNRRKTVFTSNHDPEALEQMLGPRLWSRFAARTVMVRNAGADYRVNIERPRVLSTD